MSIEVGRYTFEGPYKMFLTDELKDRAGVYAIHCYMNKTYDLIDVGETATIKSRLEQHERKGCWNRKCTGILTVSVYYTPRLRQVRRILIEQVIRKKYNPPCGRK